VGTAATCRGPLALRLLTAALTEAAALVDEEKPNVAAELDKASFRRHE
jgi:hypothetical protein